MGKSEDQYKAEVKELKKKKKELEKELNRKDKALAEMAALVTLKKKLNTILGEQEDD
jgi:seryl-tRNA synthetase